MASRRKTKNKDLILNEFKKNHILEASEIISNHPEIDPATIYRNLQRFVEDGILKELHLKKGVVSYELSNHDHQHFVCENCGKVKEIELDTLSINKILPKDIKADSFELNIKGKCEDCN